MNHNKVLTMRLCAKLLLLFLAVTLIAQLALPAARAAEGSYPYPKLLEYQDLDASFDALAKNHILPEYREYVLNAIKYHIEAKNEPGPDDYDYRIAKNLLNYGNTGKDGNVLFFFDGCSINLEGSVPCYSGFMKNGKRYNESAVCIDIRLNAAGRPEIVFATGNASTIADNLRLKATNNNNDISITRDGVYGLKAVNHGSSAANTPFGRYVTYAAMNIVLTSQGSVRMPDLTDQSKGTYYAIAGGVDVHSRTTGQAELLNNRLSSTGCFNIGRGLWDEEYCSFLEVALGISDGVEPGKKVPTFPTSSSYGYTNSSNVGVIVVDHSNYKEQLAVIVGDDNPAAPNAKTGKEIAAMITDRSEVWNREIWARCGNKGPAISEPQNNTAYSYRNANNTGVRISWTKVEDAVKYRLNVYDLTADPQMTSGVKLTKEFSSDVTGYSIMGKDFAAGTFGSGHCYKAVISALAANGDILGQSAAVTFSVAAKPAEVSGRGVVFLLDGSSSISRADFAEMQKLTKDLVAETLAESQDTKAALILIGQKNTLQKVKESDSGFYQDAGTLTKLIEEASMPGGPTNLADAIILAGELLEDLQAEDKTVVILSDGIANSCSNAAASYGMQGSYTTESNITRNVAQSFAYGGVLFDTYGFRLSSANEKDQLLKDISEMSGGTFHPVQ